MSELQSDDCSSLKTGLRGQGVRTVVEQQQFPTVGTAVGRLRVSRPDLGANQGFPRSRNCSQPTAVLNLGHVRTAVGRQQFSESLG